jgi:acetoin utilization protein AcuB
MSESQTKDASQRSVALPSARAVTVRHWMTPTPHSVGKDQPLATAQKLMHDNKCRHLPVLEHGKLVGIVSERDILFVQAIPGVDIHKTTVEDAMTQSVYCVPPEQRLRAVVQDMAENRYGCAVVVEGAKVVGVFTTTDALDVLAQHLGKDY